MRREGFGFERAVTLLDEHQHLSLGFLEFLFAGSGETYTLLEEFDRIFEAEVALLQLFNDAFELPERFFKLWHGSYSVPVAACGNTLAITSAAAL